MTNQDGFSLCLRNWFDNALDAINECQGKRIEITLSAGGLAIFDSGQGIPEDVLDTIYDFDKYAFSKNNFRTPTRGYQGNALKGSG
ncbi:MAG: ATP-binding protein [Proteobacteria bacterium]|nr:ATP-binding protein [Pseudomonadota bacterium]